MVLFAKAVVRPLDHRRAFGDLSPVYRYFDGFGLQELSFITWQFLEDPQGVFAYATKHCPTAEVTNFSICAVL